MKSRIFALLITIVAGGLAHAPRAEARKFDFKTEYIATYFGGTFGNSMLGEGAYGYSSGTGTTFDKKVQSTGSAEIGFVLTTSRFNLRLGAEYLMPREQLGVTGTNAAGQTLFTLNSKVNALIPMANLELVARETPESKIIFGVGYGIALITLENAYTMAPAGASLSAADFVEKGATRAPVWQGYIGYETLFTDTVTALIHIGYRYLPVNSIQSATDVTAIAGNETSGSDLPNSDGGKRSFNLGGPFVGLHFRFYIGI